MIDKKSGIYGELITAEMVDDLKLLEANLSTVTKFTSLTNGFDLSNELIEYLTNKIGAKLATLTNANKKIELINKTLSMLKEEILSNKVLVSIDKAKSNRNLNLAAHFDFQPSGVFTLNKPFNILKALNENAFSCSHILMVIPNLSLSIIRPLFNFFERLNKAKIKVHIITSKPNREAFVDEYQSLLQLGEYPNVSIKVQKSFYLINEIVHRYIVFMRHNDNSSVLVDFPQSLMSSSLPTDSQIGFKFRKKDRLQIYNQFYDDFILRWFSTDYLKLTEELVNDIRISRRSFEKTIEEPVWAEYALKSKFAYKLYPFQKSVLKEIQVRRAYEKQNNFLVFLGDNCGKTILSAFDYKTIYDAKIVQKPKLLFISNRIVKLYKARNQYRIVMKDASFGRIFARNVNELQDKNQAVFATRQFLVNNLDRFKINEFDYIVVEGITVANHQRYLDILKYFNCRNLLVINKNHDLLNLNDLMKLFNFNYINAIDVYRPIAEGLSKKIEYYGIGDNSSDLIGLPIDKAKPVEISYRINSKERLTFFEKVLRRYLLVSNTTRALVIAYDDDHAKKLAKFLGKMYGDSEIAIPFLSKSLEHEFDVHKKNLDLGRLKFIVATHESLEFVNSDAFNVLINHSFDIDKYMFSRKLFACTMRDDYSLPLLVLDFLMPMDRNYDYIKNKFNLFFNYYEARPIIQDQTFTRLGIFYSFDSAAQEIIFKRSKLTTKQTLSDLLKEKDPASFTAFSDFLLNHRIYLWDIYQYDRYLFDLAKSKKAVNIPSFLSPLNIIPAFFNTNSLSFLKLCLNVLENNKYSLPNNLVMAVLASFFNNNNCKELLSYLKSNKCNKPSEALHYLSTSYPELINEIINVIKFRIRYADNLLRISETIYDDIEIERNSQLNVKQILALFKVLNYADLNKRFIEELHPRSLASNKLWIVWATNAVNNFNGLCTKLINSNTLYWSSPYNWSHNSSSFKEFQNSKRPVLIVYRDQKVNHVVNGPQPYKILGLKQKIINVVGDKPLNMIIKIKS